MPFPSIEALLTTIPLYEEFLVEREGLERLNLLVLESPRINAYCPQCEQDRVFQVNKAADLCPLPHHIQAQLRLTLNHYLVTSNLNFLLSCAYNPKHIISANFIYLEDKLIKTGQYPSIADTTLPDYKKYRAVLSNEKHRELTRGIGLITHGVGIGAFVYLRRIFEHLIEEAHEIGKNDPGWEDNKYFQSRMDEKIELLKLHLPQFLVENRKLYGILSKGVHELSENECLEYFDTVKVGVELILDEKLENYKKQEKIKSAKDSLAKLHEAMSSKKAE